MDSEDAQIPTVHPFIRRVGLLACYGLIVAAILVFAGWQFRIPILRGQVFGSFVAPNTALCFLFGALSILLQLSHGKAYIRLGQIFGLAIAIFGALTLAEHITGVDLGIDRVFFAHRLNDWFLPNPGRIAVTSAIALLVGGVGLIFLRHAGRVPFADLAGSLVLGVAYIGIIGYMFGFRFFYARVMSVPTAVLFAVFGCGNTLWQPHGLGCKRAGQPSDWVDCWYAG